MATTTASPPIGETPGTSPPDVSPQTDSTSSAPMDTGPTTAPTSTQATKAYILLGTVSGVAVLTILCIILAYFRLRRRRRREEQRRALSSSGSGLPDLYMTAAARKSRQRNRGASGRVTDRDRREAEAESTRAAMIRKSLASRPTLTGPDGARYSYAGSSSSDGSVDGPRRGGAANQYSAYGSHGQVPEAQHVTRNSTSDGYGYGRPQMARQQQEQPPSHSRQAQSQQQQQQQQLRDQQRYQQYYQEARRSRAFSSASASTLKDLEFTTSRQSTLHYDEAVPLDHLSGHPAIEGQPVLRDNRRQPHLHHPIQQQSPYYQHQQGGQGSSSSAAWTEHAASSGTAPSDSRRASQPYKQAEAEEDRWRAPDMEQPPPAYSSR